MVFIVFSREGCYEDLVKLYMCGVFMGKFIRYCNSSFFWEGDLSGWGIVVDREIYFLWFIF